MNYPKVDQLQDRFVNQQEVQMTNRQNHVQNNNQQHFQNPQCYQQPQNFIQIPQQELQASQLLILDGQKQCYCNSQKIDQLYERIQKLEQRPKRFRCKRRRCFIFLIILLSIFLFIAHMVHKQPRKQWSQFHRHDIRAEKQFDNMKDQNKDLRDYQNQKQNNFRYESNYKKNIEFQGQFRKEQNQFDQNQKMEYNNNRNNHFQNERNYYHQHQRNQNDQYHKHRNNHYQKEKNYYHQDQRNQNDQNNTQQTQFNQTQFNQSYNNNGFNMTQNNQNIENKEQFNQFNVSKNNNISDSNLQFLSVEQKMMMQDQLLKQLAQLQNALNQLSYNTSILMENKF